MKKRRIKGWEGHLRSHTNRRLSWIWTSVCTFSISPYLFDNVSTGVHVWNARGSCGQMLHKNGDLLVNSGVLLLFSLSRNEVQKAEMLQPWAWWIEQTGDLLLMDVSLPSRKISNLKQPQRPTGSQSQALSLWVIYYLLLDDIRSASEGPQLH